MCVLSQTNAELNVSNYDMNIIDQGHEYYIDLYRDIDIIDPVS